MVCWTAMDTADQTKSRETLQDKEFNRSISIDHYGNTRGKFFLNNNEHDIQFNRQSRSHRNVTPEESLQNIKKTGENTNWCLTKCRREYEELSC